MCHNFLSATSFYLMLLRIDEELAGEVQAKGCPYCGGTLHSANYPRKPRGVARAVLGAAYEYRLSFCCAEEGCRRRTTPASVRFLGRRVYLGVIVALLPALANGGQGHCVRCLNTHLGVSVRTLQRWRHWWREDFAQSPFWQAARARFMPAPDIAALPASLLHRFAGEQWSQRLVALLRWLRPITTATPGVVSGAVN